MHSVPTGNYLGPRYLWINDEMCILMLSRLFIFKIHAWFRDANFQNIFNEFIFIIIFFFQWTYNNLSFTSGFECESNL